MGEKAGGQRYLLSKAARDFTLADIEAMTEQDAVKAFAQLRWGYATRQVCPACGSINAHRYMTSRRQWRCREYACSHTFSVTSGTIFQDRKLPLKTLLRAIVVFVNAAKGISSLQLSRTVGISPMAAWTLMGKLREALLWASQSQSKPLTGVVQMDAGHFGGRPRKPGRAPKKQTEQLRTKTPQSHPSAHPNRRLVMVLRQIGKKPREGAVRTVVAIVRNEDQTTAMALAKCYISRNAEIHTDEHGAYASLALHANHDVVDHGVEFSNERGANTNQAESYFTRARRMVLGQIHRLHPKFMMDYMNEVAWREDFRRRKPSERAAHLVSCALQLAPSDWWCRYFQGVRREFEILFTP
jgi:transposase-like protein